MQLTDFEYTLPPELIAQTPIEPRDQSRLLRVQRETQSLSHHIFSELPSLLHAGDVLVLNNTKVMPVRLIGQKETGGRIELLLLKKHEQLPESEVWEVLSKPGLKNEQQLLFGKLGELVATARGSLGYTQRVEFSATGERLMRLLDKLGEIPTPPYIRNFVGDPNRYQTVFAQKLGSAAAPTAGLHFTPSLLERLQEAGIEISYVTLHVGLGTFQSVTTENIFDHKMHQEYYEVSPETATLVNTAIEKNRRIIPVGTTSLRTLESAAFLDKGKNGKYYIKSKSENTGIFIYPGYSFTICDALITNFHVPKSTLLMLVSAFVSAPQTDQKFSTFSETLVGKAYQEAIKNRYRFFSFGDAMFIE